MISKERLTSRFLEMIQVYSPSKGEKEMADWIEDYLAKRGISFQSDHAGEAYGGNGRNIVAFIPGTKKGIPLGFAAHMDQIAPEHIFHFLIQFRHSFQTDQNKISIKVFGRPPADAVSFA